MVTVTERAALVPPMARLPKLKLVGEKFTGATPDPLNDTVCFPALSVIVTLPLALPVVTGEKVTEMVQNEPEAMRAVLQLSVSPNGPDTAICEICRGPVPVLCTVMERAELVVPIT